MSVCFGEDCGANLRLRHIRAYRDCASDARGKPSQGGQEQSILLLLAQQHRRAVTGRHYDEEAGSRPSRSSVHDICPQPVTTNGVNDPVDGRLPSLEAGGPGIRRLWWRVRAAAPLALEPWKAALPGRCGSRLPGDNVGKQGRQRVLCAGAEGRSWTGRHRGCCAQHTHTAGPSLPHSLREPAKYAPCRASPECLNALWLCDVCTMTAIGTCSTLL